MNFVKIGKFINTHGIKGEIRVKSMASNKDVIFRVGNSIYFGVSKKEFIIDNYRVHKNLDMLRFKGVSKIEEVLNYKGEDVFILKDDENTINLELISFNVYYNDNFIGEVTSLENNGIYDLLIIEGVKRVIIPNLDNFIDFIDYKNNKIFLTELGVNVHEN